MFLRIWHPSKKQITQTLALSKANRTPSLSSSSPESSSCPFNLMGWQAMYKWTRPLDLRSSACSFTTQLSNIVEGCSDPVLEDKIPELVLDEQDGGNVDLSCLMQSNCPEPYEGLNKAPTHLNMPGGGLRAQDKYLASEIHDVFTYERLPKF